MACAGSAIELALENAPDQQRLSEMELHERSTEENAGVTGISARPLTRSHSVLMLIDEVILLQQIEGCKSKKC